MAKKTQTPPRTKKKKASAVAPVTPVRSAPTPEAPTAEEPRRLKFGYKSFRLQKKIVVPRTRLPNVWQLFTGALGMLRKYWLPFLFIVAIYVALNLILVKGGSVGVNLSDLKQTLQGGVSSGAAGKFLTSTVLFSYIIGTSNSSVSGASGIFQLFLVLVVSLAIVWMLRRAYASQVPTVREALYQGTYPLVPVLLVLLVICLQLIPLVIGAYLYSTVTTIGVTGAENVMWMSILCLLILLSLYMLTSSLIALYVATLPDMRPMQALKSARELVRYRRWTVMRKILFLPIVLFLLAAGITIPFILFLPVVAPIVFLLYTMAVLPVIHSYMYRLYRELLV